MTPPYDPAHVERVKLARSETVVAECSCGWTGNKYDLHLSGAARGLAADLNRHRETYVASVAS